MGDRGVGGVMVLGNGGGGSVISREARCSRDWPTSALGPSLEGPLGAPHPRRSPWLGHPSSPRSSHDRCRRPERLSLGACSPMCRRTPSRLPP